MSQFLLVVALLAGLGCTPPTDEPPWPDRVARWTFPEPLPDLPLVDQDGRDFSLGRYRDDWLLVGWVFTRCGDAAACPMTMSRLVATQDAWGRVESAGQAGGRQLAVLALTLDPEHDTPELLAAFGKAHGADPGRFTLATGPRDLLADALPSMFSILSLPSATAGFVHTVKIVLLRPGLVFDAEWKDDAFSPDAVTRRVLSETPAP